MKNFRPMQEKISEETNTLLIPMADMQQYGSEIHTMLETKAIEDAVTHTSVADQQYFAQVMQPATVQPLNILPGVLRNYSKVNNNILNASEHEIFAV